MTELLAEYDGYVFVVDFLPEKYLFFPAFLIAVKLIVPRPIALS